MKNKNKEDEDENEGEVKDDDDSHAASPYSDISSNSSESVVVVGVEMTERKKVKKEEGVKSMGEDAGEWSDDEETDEVQKVAKKHKK